MIAPVDLRIDAGDTSLEAVLTRPDGPVRAGIVTLHPAGGPERDYVLFRHLAGLLAPRGVAVLSYDRRPPRTDDDVAFEVQARDAIAAVGELDRRLGADVPIGLWALSQGAWVAPLVATRSDRIAFLILVGASGVSPAAQMRYSAAEALRRAGYPAASIEQAVATRAAVEALLRGRATPVETQVAIDAVAAEPWFDLTWLPRTVPADATWADADFDPAPSIRRLGCPVLLLYGDDEAVPADESIRIWRAGVADSRVPLDVVRLPASGHLPTIGGTDVDAVDPVYERAITDWLERTLA